MALNLYKTIIAAPDNKNRIIAVDALNGCGVVFKPDTTSLEKIHVLVYVDSSDIVNFTGAVFTLDANGAPNVESLSESTLESGIATAKVAVTPSSTAGAQWITFDFSATLGSTNKHALVIASDAATSGKNGVIYRETTVDCASISAAYVMSANSGSWSIRMENGHSISPCIMYLGSAYDGSANPVNMGTLQTYGEGTRRGYSLWLTAVNDGITATGNIRLYQASNGTGTNQSTYSKETYHGSFPWRRLAPMQLPSSGTTLTYELLDAYESPAPGLQPGEFILFYQKDRSYPLPQIFMANVTGPTVDVGEQDGVANSIESIYISRLTTVSGAKDRSILEVASDENAAITVSSDVALTKTSIVKNSNGFSDSIAAGQYIARTNDTHPDNTFKVAEVVNSKEIRINHRRIHPEPEWKISSAQVGENQKAIIDHRELSSLYANGFPGLQITPSSRTRFYESKYDAVDGYLSWSNVFPIGAHSGNDTDTLPDRSADAQLPYLCVNNKTGYTSKTGNYLNCLGINVYSGRATQNYLSYVVPEVSDKEAMMYLGLMNKREYIYGNVPSAQGLVYVQHASIDAEHKDLVNAFVVRHISDVGIVLDSRLVCASYIKAGTVTEGTGTVTFVLPEFNVNTSTEFLTDYIDGGATPLSVIPNPFGNNALAYGSVDAAFKISSITASADGAHITVDDANDKFAVRCGTMDPATEDVPCYIVYRPVEESTASSKSVFGYTQYEPDSSSMDFILNGSAYEFGELASDSPGGGSVSTYDYSEASTATSTTFDANVNIVVIGLVADTDENDPNHKNYFYSEHNELQLHDFVDRLPSTVEVCLVANDAGSAFTSMIGATNSSSNKTTIKSHISAFFAAVRAGAVADNNYATLSTDMKAVYTAKSGTIATGWAALVIGSGNGSGAAATVATNLSDFKVTGFVRIHPAAKSDYMVQCAKACAATAGATSGQAITYNNSGNLSDQLYAVLSPVDIAVPNGYVRNFSLVVPAFKNDHEDVWTYTKDNITALSSMNFVPVADTPVNYEVTQPALLEWTDNDSKYAMVKNFEGPINPENITSQSDSTLFTFDRSGTGLNNRNCFVWFRDTDALNVEQLNRIFFMYKINMDSSVSGTSKVSCTVQLSGDKGFADATTVFNGTIEASGQSSVTISSQTSIDTTVNIYTMPDGYNAFSLDMSQGYSNTGGMWVRIFMEPSNAAGETSAAKSVNVRSLKAYSYDLANTNASHFGVAAGSAQSPEGIVAANVTAGASPATLSGNGSYVLVDLGTERFVNKVSFVVDNYNGVGDTLQVCYRSFIKGKQLDQSEKILKHLVLSEEITGASDPIVINARFYARYIAFKANAGSSFTLTELEIDAISPDMTGLYSGTIDYAAKNSNMAYSDENILTAPRSRVCVMDGSRNTVGMVYSANTYVNQISFNAVTSGRTMFRVQYLPAGTTVPVAGATDAAWEDLGNGYFPVINYNRISNCQVLFTGDDGSQISSSLVPSTAPYNNGLVGYVMRVAGKNDIIVPVLSSDGSNVTFANDLRELGISSGDQCYFEKPNVFSFPATQVKAIQVLQVSGEETKINSLKIYTPLVGSDGSSVAPTLGTNALSWNIILDY